MAKWWEKIKARHVSARRTWRIVLIILGALALGFLYAYPMGSLSGFKFNSPDQNQYFFTASRFSANQKLFVDEPLNQIAGGLLAPRSFRAIEGVSGNGAVDGEDGVGAPTRVVPIGFWGLGILDGAVAALAGLDSLKILNAFWALLAIVGFYLLQRKIWGARVAGWATAILAFCPIFWYLSSQPLYPQIPLLAAILWAAFGLWRALETRRWAWWLLAGLALGIALFLRLNEAVWLLPLALLALWWGRPRVAKLTVASAINEPAPAACWRRYWLGILVALGGLLLAVLPMLFLNQQVYGAWWKMGYNTAVVMAGSSVNLAAERGAATETLGGARGVAVTVGETMGALGHKFLNLLKLAYLPFGFSPRALALNFLEMLKLVWWFLIPALGVALMGLARWKNWGKMSLIKKRYYLILGLTALFLILIYGSWYVTDAVGGPRVNLGSSYWRYFLPLVVLLVPFWGVSLANWQNSRRGKWVAALMLAIFIFLSGQLIFFEPYEGLFAARKSVARGQNLARAIFDRTETQDIVVTSILDKYIFPERRVMSAALTENDYPKIGALLKAGYRVYQASFKIQPQNLEILNQKVQSLGLELRAEEELSAEIGWYRWVLRQI